ncbi:cytidine and dCMP deaminase domain-containing protein 1-like [Amblyraja radiata]|uniref:cytidine and dCMP deaminase domain-containing protein 1-like n=1 Tax=Amblyraja radiata TaxID=386614 RepID=UPI0014027A56|nr:cytidine and dCMP deaminase domain-containing protein 1-like [Amblyraja radiata]
MESREDKAADFDGDIQRLEDKETLFMLLALHMEESPLCESPISEPRGDQVIKINKTGIVVCESTSIQRIVAMDCSRKQLHAVQRVMMNLTTMAKGCNVYLSRKPCTECAKCLVQGKTYFTKSLTSEQFFSTVPFPNVLLLAVGMKMSLILNQVLSFI